MTEHYYYDTDDAASFIFTLSSCLLLYLTFLHVYSVCTMLDDVFLSLSCCVRFIYFTTMPQLRAATSPCGQAAVFTLSIYNSIVRAYYKLVAASFCKGRDITLAQINHIEYRKSRHNPLLLTHCTRYINETLTRDLNQERAGQASLRH